MKKLINETMEFLREKVENLEREILLLTDGGTARCVSDDKFGASQRQTMIAFDGGI